MEEKHKLEKIAGEYHDADLLGLNEIYHLAIRDTIIPQNGGESALEVGCGAGAWTRVLCQRYESVDVVDGSLRLLAQVSQDNRSAPARLITHHCLVEEFSPSAGSFWQHIFMTFLLEHVTDPVRVLRKIGCHMEPDSRFFIAVPNADSVHRTLAKRMGIIQDTNELSANDHRVGHRRVYTRTLLNEHLAMSGFVVVNEWSIGLKPFTLRQMESLSPEVGEALARSGDLVPLHPAYLGVEAKKLSKK